MEILAVSGDVGGQRSCFHSTNIALPLGPTPFVLSLQEVTVSDSASTMSLKENHLMLGAVALSAPKSHQTLFQSQAFVFDHLTL